MSQPFDSRAIPWLLFLTVALLAYSTFAPAAAPSPGWEYRVDRLGDGEDAAPVTAELNRLGGLGWELVSLETLAWDDDWAPTKARATLKRRRR